MEFCQSPIQSHCRKYIALALLRHLLIISDIIDVIQLIRTALDHDLFFSNVLVRIAILITNFRLS